jgi:cytochrome P450 monooxygenase
LDTSTQFIFGESISSLIYPERADIAWAMTDVLRGLRLLLQMGKLNWLLRSQKWLDAIAVVHKFVDKHIDSTFEELDRSKTSEADPVLVAEHERSDLVWSMAQRLRHDRANLRSQILLFFVPNNDTTSIFISNVFWNLAQRPDVWTKVREEVLNVGSAPLNFERLRAMKYLNSVLNESK